MFGLLFMIFLTAVLDLLGYFYYNRLIGISLLAFWAAILNCNFRLQNSELSHH